MELRIREVACLYTRECHYQNKRPGFSLYTNDITEVDREPLQTGWEHTLYCPLKAKHRGWTQRGPNCLTLPKFFYALIFHYHKWLKREENQKHLMLWGNSNCLPDQIDFIMCEKGWWIRSFYSEIPRVIIHFRELLWGGVIWYLPTTILKENETCY